MLRSPSAGIRSAQDDFGRTIRSRSDWLVFGEGSQMVTRRRKVGKRGNALKRAKLARKPRSILMQTAQSKPGKVKPGRRRAKKPKSELAQLKNLLRSAEDRQAATADILKVIASSLAGCLVQRRAWLGEAVSYRVASGARLWLTWR
jgi:hypothetical protein